MSETVLVAVYGTLKRGFANHALMAQAQFLGCDKLAQICLYDIGPYPGARLEASGGIEVEVYAVSHRQLVDLDLLEEFDPCAPASSLYTRELLATRYGLAWVYLFQGEIAGRPCIRSGTWQPQT